MATFKEVAGQAMGWCYDSAVGLKNKVPANARYVILGVTAAVVIEHGVPIVYNWFPRINKSVEERDVNRDGVLDHIVRRSYCLSDEAYVQQKGPDGKGNGVFVYDKEASQNLDKVLLPEAPDTRKR